MVSVLNFVWGAVIAVLATIGLVVVAQLLGVI
jgi:hypothetical protein